MTAKELREKRAELAKQIRQLADKVNAESRDFTAEEKPQWEKVNGDYNTMTRQIELAERAEAVEAEQRVAPTDKRDIGRDDFDGKQTGDKSGVTEEDRALALQAWHRVGADMELTDRHVEACKKTGLNPAARSVTLSLMPTHSLRSIKQAFRDSHPSQAQKRALSAVDAATGGSTVSPGTLVNSLEIAMLQFGGVLQVAEEIRTASGERMQWPTANDTSNSGVQLGESAAVSTQDPSFGAVFWDAYKFSSKEIKVPTELLEDSAFDMASVIGAMLGERLGRILNTKFTTGTGAATPKGIVTASTLGKTTSSGTAIAADELFDLYHSVDPAYRNGAGWMMHDNILLAIRKLKDGSGQYLWQSGLQDSSPDRLLGAPITINQDMQSSVATTTKTILFGQLSKYKVRMVNSMRLYRLVERHRENDQDAFLAFLRADGNLLDAGVAPVKHMLQA